MNVSHGIVVSATAGSPSWAGPIIGAAMTGGCALIVGWLVSHGIGRVNCLVHFTDRFQQLTHAMYELNKEFLLEGRAQNGAGQEKLRFKADAMALYRQMFSLLMDEFFALTQGMVTEDQMTEWMLWTLHFGPKRVPIQQEDPMKVALRIDEVGGLSHEEAWKNYFDRPQIRASRAGKFFWDIHDRYGEKTRTHDRSKIDAVRKWIARRVRRNTPLWNPARLLWLIGR